MGNDLYAERIRVVSGSSEWTIGAINTTDPNGSRSEPSGSLVRSSDGSIWINSNGTTEWIRLGAGTHLFSYTADGTEGAQASITLPSSYPSVDYKVFVTSVSGSTVSAYQVPEDLKTTSGFKLQVSAPLASGDKFDFLTLSGSVYAGTQAGNSTTRVVSVNAHSSGSNTSVSNNTLTVLPLTTEEWDTDSFHDTSTNTSRLVAPVTGYYRITFSAVFAANTTGTRQLQVRKNAAGTSSGIELANVRVNAGTSSTTLVEGTRDIFLTAGDYVEVFAFQTSGGALNVHTNSWAPVSLTLLGS